MIFDWISGRFASGCAMLLAAALAWQTARIEGLPLVGGGFKAQVTAFEKQIADRDLAEARAQSAALVARARQADAMQAAARDYAAADQAIQTHTQTILREVPRAVPNSADCLLPWGAVRLLDAAASGAALADVAAAIAPGQPDDAASDVRLSEAVALQAQNLGLARQNAGQLTHLQKAVGY